MPDSDWSGNEGRHETLRIKKSSKKRTRSLSVESNYKVKHKKNSKKMQEKDEKSKKKLKYSNSKYDNDFSDDATRKPDVGDLVAEDYVSENRSSGIRKPNTNFKSKRVHCQPKNGEENYKKQHCQTNSDDRENYNKSKKPKKQGKNSNVEDHKRSIYESDSDNNVDKSFDSQRSNKTSKQTSEKRERSSKKCLVSRNKYTQDRYDDESNRDDSDRHGSGSDKPFRYWSFSRGLVRKNSDSYWNKYSDRLKESNDHVEVGPRYYNSGQKEHKDKSKDDIVNTQDKSDVDKDDMKKGSQEIVPKPKKSLDPLTTRSGGAYIPPAKLKMLQESITDKGSAAYQRLAWEALKKSIQGHVNKVNTSNIKIILKAVVKENIVRGRGLLCRALIQAQAASPSFTNVYAAFITALNTKFPRVGELLLKRLIVQFRRGFKRNDKTICITAVTFIAHLVNQEMAHEILALEILTLLLENPTEDSVEVAIAFLKECGMKLSEVSSKGVMVIFDTLRNVLHEGKLENRVQYMIEVMFQIRKEDFKAHPAVVEELQDLVDEDTKILHMVTLEESHDPEDILNVFKFDQDYEANEVKYKSLVEEDSDDESGGSGDEGRSGSGGSDDESDEDDDNDQSSEKKADLIVDKTETNLVALRKTIYLTIQSSLDFEECAHKLLRMELKPGQEIEMAHMFLDCCSEQRTYEKFFGLLSQRFCQINRSYIGPFEETFRDSYATIHRMSNDKLRNIAKLFAHLLFTDAISWEVLSTIRLNEDDTNSSSRIFIKILFMELSEYMGLAKLNQRVKDPSLLTAMEGLFPRDNPKHTRFAINFFTSIGLGGLTDELREHLKNQPKPSLTVPQLVEELSSTSSSSSSDSSSSSSSSDSLSSSESSSSESEKDKARKKKKMKPLSKSKNQTGKKSIQEKNKRKQRSQKKMKRNR